MGPIHTWPSALVHFLNFIFNSQQPCFLFWSKEAFCFYNDGYIPILGNTKHPRSMGAKAIEIWDEIWSNYTLPQFNHAMEGNSTWNLDQFHPISRDGKIVEAYFTYGYSPLFLDDGSINGVLTTATETTDKVVASDKLKLALNVTKMGFYDWDMTTDFIVFNQQMQDDWGIEAQMTLKEVLSYIHPEDVEHVSKIIKLTIEENRDYEILYRVLNPKKGTVWIEAKGHVRYQDGKPIQFLGTSLNVTEKHLAKIAMEKTLKSRDEFLSIASHELKTPLTSLILMSQLQMKKNSSEEIVTFAKKITNQTSRLIRLVDDMLDVSRIQTGQLAYVREHVNLCELARHVLETCSHQLLQAGYEIPTVTQCDEATVFVDRLRIEQVISNLLTNAIRYGKKSPIKVSVYATHETVEVSVTDHGIGIKEEFLSRIFERFERGEMPYESSGLGLGLFISNQIIHAHSGSIKVQSQFQHGSIFTLVLPKVVAS